MTKRVHEANRKYYDKQHQIIADEFNIPIYFVEIIRTYPNPSELIEYLQQKIERKATKHDYLGVLQFLGTLTPEKLKSLRREILIPTISADLRR